MNKFKVGYNFDIKLVEIFKELNEKYKGTSRIVEVYGSDRNHAFLSARPHFRIQDIDNIELKGHVSALKEIGIDFNYTMNSINPGSKRELNEKKEMIKGYTLYLEKIGVKRITVSNPLIIEIIREVSDIAIEISTIAHIDTVSQIKYYKEKYDIDKVCGNLMLNRNFTKLSAMADWANSNGVVLDLMVNEFCGNGSGSYATHCIYRDSCYIAHASDVTKEDAELLDCYPMRRCIQSRDIDAACWLKMRFIRPEDLKHYRDIGITDFKITGRTGTTEYIKMVAEAYCSESYDGNLLGLWKNLDTIYNGKSELETDNEIEIDNKKLDGFLNKWINEDWRCDEKDCGTVGNPNSCNYCNVFWENKE